MPWQPKDLMNIKREFVELALQEGANRRELCRRFGISCSHPLWMRRGAEGQTDQGKNLFEPQASCF